MFLWMFLFFEGFQPGCSYKLFSYKKKRCILKTGALQPEMKNGRGTGNEKRWMRRVFV